MRSKLGRLILIASSAFAVPIVATAAIPPNCSPSDLASTFVARESSFSTHSLEDIDQAISKLPPSQNTSALDGYISHPEIYYPFDSMTGFGFGVKFIVGVTGRVRCIALTPSRGHDIQPEWNTQRQAWATTISQWRFQPIVIDGTPTEAQAELHVREYELPERYVPMPEGNADQVVITQDMPYFGYHIELHGDGRAVYSSTRPDYFLGPQAYRVDPESVARLLQEAVDADFWSLRDVYPPHADKSGRYISRIEITLGGKTKSLTEYEQEAGTGLSVEGHFLPFGVRHIIDLGSWWSPTLETIGQLKANGFDFKSEAAGRYLLQITETASVKDEVVLAVMDLGAPQDAFGVSREGEDPRNLLEAALSTGRTRIAEQLINAGGLTSGGQIDRSKVNRAFQASIESGDVAPIDLILPFRPELTFKDEHAENAEVSVIFKLPIPYQHDPAPTDAAQRLLDLGVDINARNSQGRTILHEVRDNQVMAEFLLDHGADINALDNEGRTPLVEGINEDMTLIFLERGANPRIGNNLVAMRTILESGRWPRVKQWLRTHGYEDVLGSPNAN